MDELKADIERFKLPVHEGVALKEGKQPMPWMLNTTAFSDLMREDPRLQARSAYE